MNKLNWALFHILFRHDLLLVAYWNRLKTQTFVTLNTVKSIKRSLSLTCCMWFCSLLWWRISGWHKSWLKGIFMIVYADMNQLAKSFPFHVVLLISAHRTVTPYYGLRARRQRRWSVVTFSEMLKSIIIDVNEFVIWIDFIMH